MRRVTTTPTRVPDSGGAVAFFDVDNTVIRGASAYHLARELYRRGFFTARDIVWATRQAFLYFLLGEDRSRIEAVRQRALDVLRGHTQAEILAIGEEVYDQVFDSRVFPGARDLIRAHREAGDEVWLVTATPVEIGQLIARRLDATGAVGSVAESVDGVYTGQMTGALMHGEQKAVAVREIAERAGAPLERCSAYGDSMNDVPMLSIVGYPCAINPEPRLRLHCASRGWPVRDFRRRRRSMRQRGLTTASLTGGVWVAAVVLRALRRRLAGGA